MVKTFSQRKGLKPVTEVIQTNSMSEALRNSLWNVLDAELWSAADFVYDRSTGSVGRIDLFSRDLWEFYFKKPVDSRPGGRGISQGREILNIIRTHFFGSAWNEVYDLLEFIVQRYQRSMRGLGELVNGILARELSAYRFVDGVLVDISSEQEIEALHEALADTRFASVSEHLRRALELLADREDPDYRNSIKESISAVEAMARIVSGESRATLGEALKALERNGQIHQALKEGFSKLYGYNNDDGGIRHAMLEKPTLDQSDAKYFLVSARHSSTTSKRTSGDAAQRI